MTERNKWETAIRCLEVALHPHTNDDEIVAGVNGFRRTADGTPLREICIEFAAPKNHDVDDRNGHRLHRENLELRRQLRIERSSRAIALHHVREAERRIRDLSEELRAAQRRAGEVERQLDDLRAAKAPAFDELKREKFTPARQAAAVRQTQTIATAPFRMILAAALDRNPERGGSPIYSPTARAPWTA
jgi:septal ring factor EnvC (AmiA/AmiB activator)